MQMSNMVIARRVHSPVLATIIRNGGLDKAGADGEHPWGETVTELRRAGLIDEAWDLTFDLYEYALSYNVMSATGEFRVESPMRVWFGFTDIRANGLVTGQAAVRAQYALAALLASGRISIEPNGTIGKTYRASC